MNHTDFTLLLEDTYRRMQELNRTKVLEYADKGQVLSDFYEVAEATGITPEQALLTYATKHWRAINTFAREGHVRSEAIVDRIGDLQFYCLLLEALVVEQTAGEAQEAAVAAAWGAFEQTQQLKLCDLPAECDCHACESGRERARERERASERVKELSELAVAPVTQAEVEAEAEQQTMVNWLRPLNDNKEVDLSNTICGGASGAGDVNDGTVHLGRVFDIDPDEDDYL